MATSKKLSSQQPSDQNGSQRRFILLMLLQFVFVAGVSVAATWVILTRLNQPSTLAPMVTAEELAANAAHADGQTVPPPQVVAVPVPETLPEPIFYELAPFTVTVEDEVSERLLHVGMTLRVADEASRARLERYLPEVRSRILLELARLAPNDLKRSQGRTELVAALLKALNRPFDGMHVGQFVSDVLFTTFMVQ